MTARQAKRAARKSYRAAVKWSSPEDIARERARLNRIAGAK